MRKLILILFILLSCATLANSGGVISFPGGGVLSGKNFLTDADCIGAYYMNNNGGNEVDRCTAATETLITGGGGTIPTSDTTPAGFGGKSRWWVAADSETLYKATGGALDIGGVDQKISICVWFKPTSDTSADQQLVGKFNASGDQQGYMLRGNAHGSSAPVFITSPDGNAWIEMVATTDVVQSTDWVHLCGVYDDIDLKIYVNGVLEGTPLAETGGIFANSAEFVVGAYDSNGTVSAVNGLIDELILLKRDISSTEVLQIKKYGIDGANGSND